MGGRSCLGYKDQTFPPEAQVARTELIKRQFAKSCNRSNVESAVTLWEEMKNAAWRNQRKLPKKGDLKALQAQRKTRYNYFQESC